MLSATSSSRSFRRAATATAAPSPASAIAVAAPIPLDAPVTSATVPSRLSGVVRVLPAPGAAWSKKGVSGMTELLKSGC